MTDHPDCILRSLESGQWRLRAPLTLWQHQSGAGWCVGNHALQVCGLGDTPEEALEDYCRALIEAAEHIERRHEMLGQIMASSAQDGEDAATE